MNTTYSNFRKPDYFTNAASALGREYWAAWSAHRAWYFLLLERTVHSTPGILHETSRRYLRARRRLVRAERARAALRAIETDVALPPLRGLPEEAAAGLAKQIQSASRGGPDAVVRAIQISNGGSND